MTNSKTLKQIDEELIPLFESFNFIVKVGQVYNDENGKLQRILYLTDVEKKGKVYHTVFYSEENCFLQGNIPPRVMYDRIIKEYLPTDHPSKTSEVS